MAAFDPERRTFVRQAGLAGLALSAGAIPAWELPDAWLAADEEVIPFTDVPADFSTKRGDTVVRFDLRELRSWITPTDQFFGVQHYGVPKVDAAAWRLETAGLFGQTRTWTLDDLKKRPRIERTVFFECSGNRAQAVHGLLGNATWAGASLKDLLHELKPLADASEETIRGNKYPMHFARSMALDDAVRSDAILAYEMNGQPLPVGHGFP